MMCECGFLDLDKSDDMCLCCGRINPEFDFDDDFINEDDISDEDCSIGCEHCEYNDQPCSKLNESKNRKLFQEAMEQITDYEIRNKIMMYILELEYKITNEVPK